MEIKIIKGKQNKKFVTLVYGEPGVGKSTFGSLYPDPVFLGNEVPHHIDVHKTPNVDTFDGLMATANAIKAAQEKKQQFKTIVIDSLSGIQDGLVAEILGPNVTDITGKHASLSIHTYGTGFGAGQYKVLARFVAVYNILDSIPGIDDIVLTSHTRNRKHRTTLDNEEDKLTPALETKILEFFYQKADNVFFLDSYKTAVKMGEKIESQNKRFVRTVGTQFYMAKNRSRLKDHYVYTGPATIKAIKDDIKKQLEAKPNA